MRHYQKSHERKERRIYGRSDYETCALTVDQFRPLCPNNSGEPKAAAIVSYAEILLFGVAAEFSLTILLPQNW